MPNASKCATDGSVMSLIKSLWHGELTVCKTCGASAPYRRRASEVVMEKGIRRCVPGFA